jgi:hypothetical protein
MIKPHYKKVYKSVMLEAFDKTHGEDSCQLVFKEDCALLHVSVDGTGNTFILPYEWLEEMVMLKIDEAIRNSELTPTIDGGDGVHVYIHRKLLDKEQFLKELKK